eukprot:TRINITY_DN34231_c0_g1_i1.p1 TRINITY_DN34231_c0_g1~~TRINITY_DN34231_c0_g1_i1.p1  ORF type:complete len:404 (-),score=46.61 TRINITY_DN34231_c0_g1_i1:112-1323(-)
MKRARKQGNRADTSFCSSYNSPSGGGHWKRDNSWWKQSASWKQNWSWSRGDTERPDEVCDCGPPRDWKPEAAFIDTHCHLECLDSCEALPPSNGQPGYAGWWERSSRDAVTCVQHTLGSISSSTLLCVISNCCDPLDFAWYEGLMAGCDSGELGDERVYWSVGIHPYAAQDFETRRPQEPHLEQRMLALAAHPRCVAIGECGLDYCKASESHEFQKRVFQQLCCLAVTLKKTLIVHARDAPRDTLRILKENVPPDWPIHLHGYTGEAFDAQELLDSFPNLCIGLCGAITIEDFYGSCGRCAPLWLPGCRFCGDQPEWVSRDLDALIYTIPLDRMLLETDAPYMTPMAFGFGRFCQLWMLTATAEHIAKKKGIQTAEVIKASNKNAQRLYHLDLKLDQSQMSTT